jgi:hypothetical protein
LHCPILLPILRRTPDKQHAKENERYEQHQDHDHNEGDIHTVVLPEAPRFYAGGELQALFWSARSVRKAPFSSSSCPGVDVDLDVPAEMGGTGGPGTNPE